MNRRTFLVGSAATVAATFGQAGGANQPEIERLKDVRDWKKVKTFVETFHKNDGHWMPWRSELIHDAENHRMLLKPTRTDGDYYCWTGTARPGQRYDYGLFGNAAGATASIDVGLASGSFSEEAGNIHIFVAYCPTHRQYFTLWSKAYVKASDLTKGGTTIRNRLIPSEWKGSSSQSFDFPYVPLVDFAYVFSHLDEFGVTHAKRWNGRDDGVLWFDNAAIIIP